LGRMCASGTSEGVPDGCGVGFRRDGSRQRAVHGLEGLDAVETSRAVEVMRLEPGPVLATQPAEDVLLGDLVALDLVTCHADCP
jgi:hypothetical protein